MRNVVVYRHQLFMRSEVFIVQQATALTGFRSIFVGRELYGQPPQGATVRTLAAAGRVAVLRSALLRDPAPYVAAVQDLDPVLVHAHFGVEGVYALGLARRLGRPLVTTFHGFDATRSVGSLLQSRKPSWIHYALGRSRLAAEGDLFICVSDFVRRRVLELGFPEERSITHYIGVDTDAIRPAATSQCEKTVLHVARLVEVKGTHLLIEAFERIAQRDPKARLDIIGDGPLRASLEKLTRSLRLEDRVRFLGEQPHDAVLDRMHGAATVCLPSLTTRSGQVEGLGMVLLEAAAAGKPVVATRHGGIPECVVDGETGFLVAERDTAALADRLLTLLSDPPLRERMGQAARRRVAREFDLRRQTANLEKLYQGLL